MNGINLDVLYLSKMFSAFILSLYGLYIFKNFHRFFSCSYLLPLYQFLIFMSLFFTYIGIHSPMPIIFIFSTILFYVATECFIYFLTKLNHQPPRIMFRTGLMVIFLVFDLIFCLVASLRPLSTLIISFFTIAQYVTYLIDYFNRPKTSPSPLKYITYFIFISIGMIVVSTSRTIFFPNLVLGLISGDLFTSISLVLYILNDLMIAIYIGIQLNRLAYTY